MARSDSKLDICNKALLMMGAAKITSLSDESTEAEVVDTIYEDLVRSTLTETRWRFATIESTLSRATTGPTGGFWSARYAMPADCLFLSNVTVNGYPIKYEVLEDFVHCNASTNDTVVAEHIARVPESSWPPWFVLLIITELATALSVTLARDSGLYQLLSQQAEKRRRYSRHTDSLQQTTGRIDQQALVRNRRT